MPLTERSRLTVSSWVKRIKTLVIFVLSEERRRACGENAIRGALSASVVYIGSAEGPKPLWD